MRFISPLTTGQQRLLGRLHKYSCFHRMRIRAHCIQLSSNGYTTTELMQIFQVARVTLYNWFDTWDQDKFAALYGRRGKDRNPTFSDSQQEQIKQWGKQNPRNFKRVVIKAAATFGNSVSKKTIQRVVKVLVLMWCCVCYCLKGRPNPDTYVQKKQELLHFSQKQEAGLINLWYLD